MKGVDRKVVTQSQIEISLMVCSSALRDWLHFSRWDLDLGVLRYGLFQCFFKSRFLFYTFCKQVLTIYIRFEFILHSEIGMLKYLTGERMNLLHDRSNQNAEVQQVKLHGSFA